LKLEVSIDLNLKTKEVTKETKDACINGLRDVTVDILAGAVRDSPRRTGNNRRSLDMQVSGLRSGEFVDPSKIESAVFSTSGYGGYLETGAGKREARPYIKPNVDKEFTASNVSSKIKRYMT